GNLFAFLIVVMGYLLLHFGERLRWSTLTSWLGLIGFLMPVGILAEVYLGAPPVFVLIGALAMTAAVFLLGTAFFNLKPSHGH
ncbi:MAG: hypothetical protein KDC02_16540, partial [Flavobacteriales bacterium]|nr:hypothetical protein [Flavobacteriales bacterium]